MQWPSDGMPSKQPGIVGTQVGVGQRPVRPRQGGRWDHGARILNPEDIRPSSRRVVAPSEREEQDRMSLGSALR